MPASALRESGLFDEELFAILEDVDLMFRVRLAGLGAELVPHVHVLHKRRISGSATTSSSLARRQFWIDRNVVALAIRYWPARHLLAASPLLAVRSARALYRGGRSASSAASRCGGAAAQARGNRRAMRRLGLDRWFTGTSVRGQVGARTRLRATGERP